MNSTAGLSGSERVDVNQMRRREFLATMPWAVEVARRREGGSISGSSVSIVALGSLHPRVWWSIKELVRELRELNYAVTTREGVRARGPSDICSVVGVTDKPKQQ